MNFYIVIGVFIAFLFLSLCLVAFVIEFSVLEYVEENYDIEIVIFDDDKTETDISDISSV